MTAAGGQSSPAPADRAGIRLAVLNGAGVSGIAHRIAAKAQQIGYTKVSAGDAPRQSGASTVYFRPRAAAAAAQVAKDLDIAQPRPLPSGGALATAAPPPAQVIVVLG